MKLLTRLSVSIVLAVLALSGIAFGKTISAPPSESNDKTLSPYFFVKSDDPALDQLPLKSTSANVNISGVIADVTVTQTYKNEAKAAGSYLRLSRIDQGRRVWDEDDDRQTGDQRKDRKTGGGAETV